MTLQNVKKLAVRPAQLHCYVSVNLSYPVALEDLVSVRVINQGHTVIVNNSYINAPIIQNQVLSKCLTDKKSDISRIFSLLCTSAWHDPSF
jgi:hypothetical protein